MASPGGTLLVQPPLQTPGEAEDLRAAVLQSVEAGAAEGEKTARIGGMRYIMAYTSANSNGWYIYGMIPVSVIYGDVTATALWSVLLVLVLFCGTAVYDPDQCRSHLQALDCQWIMDSPLMMCLLSIDNYAQFSQENNPREREVLRYAVVNMAAELLGEAFRCEMVEHSADRFIAVQACPEGEEFAATAGLLEKKLEEILSVVKKHLKFSLTAVYGTPFTGAGHMARAYENLEELLLLRIRHGSGRVFPPRMADELDLDGFQASSAAENLLISSVVNGSARQAAAQFDHIARSLFQFNPGEIIPYLLHLAYRLLNSVKEADSTTGAQAAKEFRQAAPV